MKCSRMQIAPLPIIVVGTVYGRPKRPKLINLKIDINKINKRQHRIKLTDIHKIKNKSREIQQQFFPN